MRYVVLHHTGIEKSHYDLMLDVDGVSLLQTYQLSQWPITSDDPYEINRIDDHRRIYLEYQGEISGNRGTVKRVVSGSFQFLDSQHTTIQIDGNLVIHLNRKPI